MVKRVVELGQELHPGTFAWPSDASYQEEHVYSEEDGGWGYRYTHLRLTTHTGTHCDAPTHFSTGDQGRTLSSFRDGELVAPGVVLRIPKEPLEQITADDCRRALRATGRSLPERPAMLLHTGFSERQLTYDVWADEPVFLAESAASWLVEHGARIVGTDSSNFDGPGAVTTSETVIHNTLLGAGVLLIEDMVRLAEVTWPEPVIVVAPLAVRDGDGAPCRVFALEIRSCP
jgi:arylformamidase